MLPDFSVVNLLQQLRVLVDEPRFPQDVGCCVLDLQEESWLQVPGPAVPARRVSQRHGSGSATRRSPVSPCCKSTRLVPAGARRSALLPRGLLHLCKGARAARAGLGPPVHLPPPDPAPVPRRRAPHPPRKRYPKPGEKERNPELFWAPASTCRCWQVLAELPAGGRGFRRLPG